MAIFQGKCLQFKSGFTVTTSPYQPLRCVITEHNVGCGATTGSANTLSRVKTWKLLWLNLVNFFFFREQQKCPYFTGTWILFHSHIFFKAICGVPDPKKCPKLWWVFIFMHNWSAGECGVKEGQFCVSGKSTVSSPENTAYALCALELLSPSSFPFYLHIKIVIWAMSETTFFWEGRSSQ